MSAPEVRVLVERRADGTWRAECPCGERVASGWMRRETADTAAREHEATCAAIQLARLQARWDARDTALRALITQWRAHPGSQHHTGTTVGSYAAGRIDSADELERAMGGGHG